MATVIIFILVIWGLYMLGPYIKRWLMRIIASSIEKRMRQYFDMPDPPKKGSGGSKQTERPEQRNRNGRYHPPRPAGQPAIPKEYAEDVEFIEYKNVSTTTEIRDEKGNIRYTEQEQVTDIEFVEIKS